MSLIVAFQPKQLWQHRRRPRGLLIAGSYPSSKESNPHEIPGAVRQFIVASRLLAISIYVVYFHWMYGIAVNHYRPLETITGPNVMDT